MPLSKSKTEDLVKPILCPTEADLKFKMTRFSIESVNLFFVEAECACNIKVCISSNYVKAGTPQNNAKGKTTIL